MKKYKITVDHVWKSFSGNQILKDVNISFESGKIYGIVGHNGSGKTVLFKCICGFFKVDQGKIQVNGKIMGKDMDMLHDAGIIIEEPGYLRNKSGYKNLEFLYKISNKRDRTCIQEAMIKVGLDPYSKKHVCHYSLGMRQRLAIAQATMENQSILIFDEPMNGLDRHGIEQMRIYFEKLKEEGKLIILASHNKEDIDVLCDQVYEMDNGVLSMLG